MSGDASSHDSSSARLARRLTVILSADVHGYSRLMSEDEEQTVQTLTAYRAVLSTIVTQHGGRVVDMPGDNLLDERAVQAYLASRLTGATALPGWTMVLHRRTGGNPLFLVNMLDYLIQQGVIIEEDGRWRIQDSEQKLAGEVPDTLRRLIEKQFERLTPEDQQLLEVASVEGREFVSAAVAAGLQANIETVEEQCERLARKSQFIRGEGVEHWPDGAIGGRYSFLHALYQNVLYENIAEARRVRLHRALGLRKEQAYGKQVREIAGELAVHFAAGRDLQRAVTYSQQAAETAVRRHAHQEAVAHVTKGLELLGALPDTAERGQHELGLQVTLATSLMALKGYAAEEVEQAYGRAHELCQQVETTPHLFPVLRGLVSFYQVRAQLQTARELGEQLLHLCQSVDDTLLQVQAHYGHGVTLFDLAEFDSSTAQLTRTLTLYTPSQHSAHASLYGGYDPGVACLQWLARILWIRGYPTQAKQRSDEALNLARELGHPLSLTWAWNIAAVIHQYRGEEPAAQAYVQEALSTAQEHELAFMAALAMILQGWGLIGQGQRIAGIEKIREGVTAYQATGAVLSLPAYFSLLAGAHARNGQMMEAQRLIAEAVTRSDETGERWFAAELYRIKGELTLIKFKVQSSESKVPNIQHPTSNPQAEAEACFLQALETARQQQAKSWELRAAMSLARLWHSQDNISDARRLLEESYHWFTEGFDTKDLQEAQALLTTLGGSVKKPERQRQNPEGQSSLASSILREEPQKIQVPLSQIASPHPAPRTLHPASSQRSTLGAPPSARGTQPSALSPRPCFVGKASTGRSPLLARPLTCETTAACAISRSCSNILGRNCMRCGLPQTRAREVGSS